MCDNAWTTCSEGRQQSPISILTTTTLQDHNIAETTLRFKTVFAKSYNRSGLAQVEVATPANDAYLIGGPRGGFHYLQKISFHAPSEHAFDGFRASAAAQFWFQDNKGVATYVLDLMFIDNSETPNAWIDRVLTAMKTNSTTIDLNPQSAFPTDLTYYFYEGSDTVPPCQQGWTWLILRHPMPATLAQVAAIREWQGIDHIRPLQPLNGRNITIEYSQILVSEDPNTFIALLAVSAIVALVGCVLAIIVNRQATEELDSKKAERKAYLVSQRQEHL
jgi:carbonic anhydrase